MMTTGKPLSVAMMTITFFVDMNIDIDFVSFVRFLLFYTRSHSLPKALFAFSKLLSISLSILASDVGMHPK